MKECKEWAWSAPSVSGAWGVDKLRHFPCRFQSAPSNLQSFINYQENAAAACIFAGKKSKQTTKLVFHSIFRQVLLHKDAHTHWHRIVTVRKVYFCKCARVCVCTCTCAIVDCFGSVWKSRNLRNFRCVYYYPVMRANWQTTRKWK